MSELSSLKQAQYHLKQMQGHIMDNKWYSHLNHHFAAVEGELQRQVSILENTKDPKVKILETNGAGEIPETDRLYDVLEEQTNGFFPPDPSYTRLSRVRASSKYEDLLAEGVSPNSIKIVRVK